MKRKKTIKQQKPLKNLQNLEKYIKLQNEGFEPEIPLRNNGKDVSRSLVNTAILAKIKKCGDCKLSSSEAKRVLQYVERGIVKKVGCCDTHWIELSELNVGWQGEK